MQKSTIVTHTVDQGNIKEKVKEIKRWEKRRNISGRKLSFKGQESPKFLQRQICQKRKLESTICSDQAFWAETPLLHSRLEEL